MKKRSIYDITLLLIPLDIVLEVTWLKEELGNWIFFKFGISTIHYKVKKATNQCDISYLI